MPSFARSPLTLVHDQAGAAMPAPHLAPEEHDSDAWDAQPGWSTAAWSEQPRWTQEPAWAHEPAWTEQPGRAETLAWDDTPATSESWRMDALCAETDPEAYFPEKGGSTRDAKRVCGGCPVRAQCLEFALANDERFGIWGGLSERERRRLRQQRVAAISA
jgi:WhiB family redox-sensing transcriptional regulator